MLEMHDGIHERACAPRRARQSTTPVKQGTCLLTALIEPVLHARHLIPEGERGKVSNVPICPIVTLGGRTCAYVPEDHPQQPKASKTIKARKLC